MAFSAVSSVTRRRSRPPWRTISSSVADGSRRSTSNGLADIDGIVLGLGGWRFQLGQQIADVVVGRVEAQRFTIEGDLALAVGGDEAAEVPEIRQRRTGRQIAGPLVDPPRQMQGERREALDLRP